MVKTNRRKRARLRRLLRACSTFSTIDIHQHAERVLAEVKRTSRRKA